ncbi:hypothetical protein [Haloarchaeobius sp. HRN-SO-5]|uniref:hypothetical protein n=1 Tax=Haloarchaeobius sp. HRN-SO-5 TaxID=3446118 RepID=UPI003EBE2ACF
MKRRVYLRALAVAGTTAVAGCQSMPTDSGPGDDGPGTGGDGTNSASDGGQTDEEATAEHLRSAVGALNRVGYRLSELESQLESDPTQVDLDTEETLAVVEAARSDLDAAAETATDDQLATIETLRSLTTVLASMTRLVALLSTVDTEGRLESVQTDVEKGDYDAALSAIRDGNETARQADEYVTTATEAADSMDPDRLDAVDAVAYDELEPALTAASRLVDGLLAVTRGYESVLLGREDLATARTAIENESFDAAETALADGRAHFEAADESFASVGDDAPEVLAQYVTRADCQTDHLVLATDHFQAAVEDARRGAVSAARTHRDDAEAELQRVDDC